VVKVERGERSVDRLSVLGLLAAGLGVDVRVLLVAAAEAGMVPGLIQGSGESLGLDAIAELPKPQEGRSRLCP